MATRVKKMTKRSHISLRTKLAAALLEIDRLRSIVHHEPRIIAYEDSKWMDDDWVISKWHWDHYPERHADGGPSRAWNLTPVSAAAHREKTAKVDVPEMAKSKRIRAKLIEHAGVMNEPALYRELIRKRGWRTRKIPSRPFPKRNKRKLKPLYP